jgi:nucleotide-binding universal stress UspA family protein
MVADDTKGSRTMLTFLDTLSLNSAEIVLLHVGRLEGRSRMIDMLGKAELSTLREALDGTDHKEALDRKSEKIVNFYKGELERRGSLKVKTVLRTGIAAEEILKVADEEGVEMIILGQNIRTGLNRFIAGDVVKEVEGMAKVPVLVAKLPLMCQQSFTQKDAVVAASVTTAVVVSLFLIGMFVKSGVVTP